jgi:hypothetical protein
MTMRVEARGQGRGVGAAPPVLLLALLVGAVAACGGGGGGGGGKMPGAGGGGGGGKMPGAGGSGGTGASGGTISCTLFQSQTTKICEEATGLSQAQADSLKQQCMAPPGDAGTTMAPLFTNGPCPRADSLGGCQLASGGVSTTSFSYEGGGLTPDDIRMICVAAGATYVAP